MVTEPIKFDKPEDAGVDVPVVKGANKPSVGIMPKLPPMNNALDNPMGKDINPNDPAPWEKDTPGGEGAGDDPVTPVTPPTPSVDPNQPGAADPNQPGEPTPDKPTGEPTPQKPIDPQSALAQKEHWRNKAVDPETGKTYKELLEEKEKASAPAPAPQPEKKETPEDFQKKQDFLWKHTDKKYTPEEFAHIKGVADSQGKSLDEAAESEESYIDFQRTKVANEKNVPTPSFPGSPAAGDEIPSHEKIDNMTEEDFRKEEERVHKSGQGGQKGGGI